MILEPTEHKAEALAAEELLLVVRVELPEELHSLLGFAAANQNVSAASMARTAIEEYLYRRAIGK
jgi:hypothetical protein